MKHEAIYKLYPSVKRIEEDENGVFTFLDENNEVVSIDEVAVETEATSLEAEYQAKVQANKDLKASARQKLMNGEPLTEDEAKTIVL